jgi:translation initiation factor 1
MSDARFNNPFSSLAPLASKTGDAAPASPAPATPVNSAPARPAVTPAVARAVVRLERSGRGGKEVTVVEHLDLKPADRERWLKELKAALGCGGSVEGDTLALQGDHRKRLPDVLVKRGVKKVTVGT